MRKLTFFATVAFSCCGLTSSFGQAPRHTAAPTHLAPSLLTAQAEEAPLSLADESPAAADLPNPFNYFSDSADAPASPSAELEFGAADQPAAHPLDRDPSSLSVGSAPGRSLVQTILNQATLDNVPDACAGPIAWGAAPQTPNPVAQWLMRESCVDGLWDGYEAQRAQECIRMWEHLSGQPHGGYLPGGPCTTCTAPPVRNRYKERLFGKWSTQEETVCDQPVEPLHSPSLAPPLPQVAPSDSQAAAAVDFYDEPASREQTAFFGARVIR